MEGNTIALQVLRQAMRLEQDGYEFYTEAAKRTEDQHGRETFLSLADDEKLHLRILRDQYEGLSAGKGWGSFAEALELKPVDLGKPLFPPQGESAEKVISVVASDADALLLAMQKENESYELYRKSAVEIADPVGKDMYQRLASYEHLHFNILMLNYEHLISTGSWRGL